MMRFELSERLREYMEENHYRDFCGFPSKMREVLHFFTKKMDKKIAPQKMQFIAIPYSSPIRSLAMPTIQGPNIPPRPPKARKIPSVRPLCDEESPDTIAVEVGKIIE